tara:strand:- start:183 stop:611 length:429 start_codon:yes stop_codon:yes gene_type:complete
MGNQLPISHINAKLRKAGVRPTKQRLALAELLFSPDHRHVTAEELYDEALKASIQVSLATVYNTLNQFKASGLLREVFVDSAPIYFDTNVAEHNHLYFEDSCTLHDFSSDSIIVRGIPDFAPGMEVARIDVVVRVRTKSSSS